MGTVSFNEEMDQFFSFCNEKIAGKGEDSLCYSFRDDSGVLGVFDGCGGLGAEKYEKLGDHTGAYMASRIASTAVMQWFVRTPDINTISMEDLRQRLDKLFYACTCIAEYTAPKLRGSMVRPFPTTMAVWLLNRRADRLIATSISAGDSRTYLLDLSGLAQISVDDIIGEDAMSNIYNDGAMTNVISADGNYHMTHTAYGIDHPCILFAATDGCFGYTKSPMEFEYMLLSTLAKAQNVDQWQSMLENKISEAAGDDQTLAAVIIGYGTFQKLQQAMEPRFRYLEAELRAMEDTRQSRQQLWETYKVNYYRLAEGGIPHIE